MSQSATQSVARLLCDSLEAHDVDQVYCVPGESYIGLTSAMVERNSIRVVVCRHEAGAGFMAVADGRLRNRPMAELAFDVEVDAVTSATMSAALIFDEVRRTAALLSRLP